MKKSHDFDPDLSLKEAELSEVLSSRSFVRARGMTQFLSYICRKTLAGEGAEIKEYTVGVEAFGRGPDFSPKDDSIVRVEANRLRKRLQEYYKTDGKNHPVQISLPQGSYSPVFRLVDPLPGASPVPGSPVQPRLGDWTVPEKGRLSAIRRRILSPAFAAVAVVAVLLSIALILTTGRQAESNSLAAETIPIVPPSGEEIRILAGSPFAQYVDRQGRTWLGDRFFTGGFARSRPDAGVFRTTDPEIYRHRREGVFRYDIPLKPGLYELRLHFVELVYGEDRPDGGGEASRLVKVLINNEVVLPAFDIMTDAGGDSSALVKVLTDISPAADGFLHIGFQSNKANAVLSGIEVLAGLPGKMRPVRISTRSTPYYDSDRVRWDADCYYRDGRSLSRLTPIKTDKNAELYQTERFGNFSYGIPVAAQGAYTISLTFCENYFGDTNPDGRGLGERVFNVFCNGEALLRNLDIMREAGGSQIPLKKSFRHMKPSAQANFLIHFVPVKNYASVSAIEVLPE